MLYPIAGGVQFVGHSVRGCTAGLTREASGTGGISAYTCQENDHPDDGIPARASGALRIGDLRV